MVHFYNISSETKMVHNSSLKGFTGLCLVSLSLFHKSSCCVIYSVMCLSINRCISIHFSVTDFHCCNKESLIALLYFSCCIIYYVMCLSTNRCISIHFSVTDFHCCNKESLITHLYFSIAIVIITTRQRSCWKVMLSQVSVTLSTRGWVCLVPVPFWEMGMPATRSLLG